ncbi:cobalamin biosynthesis protein CbiD [bacterium 1XD21-13]|nr:cobalamin biosynthesis protein CbiD [bacterium 1XD21-13]
MLDKYVYKNNQKMRLGYTTGSCAAGAAKAAAQMLLTGKPVPYVELMTPKGIRLNLEVLDLCFSKDTASCAIRKDAGDDPDVTHGLKVYATVHKTQEAGIYIEGGEGVGRVTREGLEQPVGSAAINSVPRAMIREGVEEVCRRFGYQGGISVIISIPKSRELAKKTFNPRLGIEGGISVLGTSGIVEPMSEAALIETIRMEIRMQHTQGHRYLVLAPGNYGLDFLKEYNPALLEHCVKYSNFLGEAIDAAVEYGFQGVLLAGHIGKLVKLAGGIMNTHSRNADARMEILTAHAAVLGAGKETAEALMTCVTTDEALDILKEAGLLEGVMSRLMERMEFYVNHRSGDAFPCAVITFSQKHGILGKSARVEEIL